MWIKLTVIDEHLGNYCVQLINMDKVETILDNREGGSWIWFDADRYIKVRETLEEIEKQLTNILK